MSGNGLPQDASRLILQEDVVRRAHPTRPSRAPLGLVTDVFGQSEDEALSESEEEVRLRPLVQSPCAR